MCLSKVERIYKGTSRKIKVRYKVFFQSRETEPLRPLYVSVNKNLPEGVWLNEKNYRDDAFQGKEKIERSDGEECPIGWHVFLAEEDARVFALYWYPYPCVIRKVLCKGLLARGGKDDAGEEDDVVVEVYKYIKIEKEG